MKKKETTLEIGTRGNPQTFEGITTDKFVQEIYEFVYITMFCAPYAQGDLPVREGFSYSGRVWVDNDCIFYQKESYINPRCIFKHHFGQYYGLNSQCYEHSDQSELLFLINEIEKRTIETYGAIAVGPAIPLN